MRAFEERHGVRIMQAWGMTETSPLASVARPRTACRGDDALGDRAPRQGAPLPLVETRLIDDDGEEVPWDGEATGELEVRGPWIAARVLRGPGRRREVPRRLAAHRRRRVDRRRTATIQISDRTKDVIKSGGEWISSVDLEGEIMAHPARRRGGGDRDARRALDRAAARLRGAATRAQSLTPDELREHLADAGRQVVAARRDRRSSTRSRRRASASSTRRCCAPSSRRGRSSGPPRDARRLRGAPQPSQACTPTSRTMRPSRSSATAAHSTRVPSGYEQRTV